MRTWIGAALLVACHGKVEGPADDDGDGVSVPADCDDHAADVFPGADEVPYDAVDQDCDGADLVDVDQDGVDGRDAGGDDCDDQDPGAYPGAAEVPYDAVDQDCDGADLDDQDLDGFVAVEAGGDDCDDLDPARHPTAADRADDGVDQNCDGVDGLDADHDGFAGLESLGDDCDDADPARHPGATEVWYDGVDQDCDDACDYDQDGDGAVLEGTLVTDGSPCDQLFGPLAGANEDCDEADPLATYQQSYTRVPEAGDLDFPADGAPTVDLLAADPAATLALTGPDGAVPGVVTVVGATVTFRPDLPLVAGASYTETLTHACGIEEWTFSVGYPRDPVDAASLVGQVWDVSLDSGVWPGGTLVFPYLTHSLLVSVDASGLETLDLTLAPALAGAQDLCAESTALPGTSFADNPTFAGAADPVTLRMAGVSVALYDATLDGVFAGGGATLVDLRLKGVLETAPLSAAVFGASAPPDLVCNLIGCVACPDGSLTCADLNITGLEGAPVVAAVVPRTSADIAADPTCP